MNGAGPAVSLPEDRSLLRGWLMPTRLFPLLLVLYYLAHVFFLCRGQFTNDEGYYLYSSTLAMKGGIPYKDFAFWQPPAILYVYGFIGDIFGRSLLTARAFSVLFGVIAFLLMAQVMKRRGGPHAVSILSILLVCNLSYAFDTSNVKTQSLSILIYTLAIFVAAGGPLTPWRCGLSSILVALAAGARIPLLGILPFFWGFICLESGGDWRSAVRSIGASVATLLAGGALFCWLSGGRVLFGLWGFFARTAASTSETFLSRWHFEMFVGDQMVCYALLAAILTALVVLVLRRGALQGVGRRVLHEYRLEIFLAGAWLATTALNLLSPIKYATHQNTNLPLLAMFLALVIARPLQGLGAPLRVAFYSALVWLCALSAMFQHAPLDRSGGKTVSEQFDRIAETIRPQMREGGKLLTFLPIIAYEGNYTLLDGLAMGAESHFGACGMTTEECRKYKGVDNRILYDYITTRAADVIVFDPYELKFIRHDSSGVTEEQLLDALARNYTAFARFENVGQFEERATCWARR